MRRCFLISYRFFSPFFWVGGGGGGGRGVGGGKRVTTSRLLPNYIKKKHDNWIIQARSMLDIILII